MDRPLPDISSLRPAGGKRSTKRDRILSIFVRQQGHLSADDLCDLVRREDPGIGRATVYRTLQWMVGAGVARKVDFGDGRSRFEPAYRHPRHFHLICTICHRSSEFLSSDVESLLEEIAGARSFAPAQTVVQVSGTCEACRTGTTPAPIDGGTTELVFARDALRIAIATERGGLEFYKRAASLTSDLRGRGVFQRLAAEEREHLSTLETRYRELLAQDPQLESRPAFLFFKGAASGLFAEGTEKLRRGIDDLQALLIGIKC
jgi:Fur family ferric uptake transcriptional regulator